tara:strand:+ start:2148 stop:2606 length:459 start_codon:yes stop_codon:yes gene_type:complete
MNIYQYIDENPKKHTVALKTDLDSLDKQLEFYLGAKLPNAVRNFLSVCNGVSIGGFLLYSDKFILSSTLDNIEINLDDQPKRIELGRADDTFIFYNYVDGIVEWVEYSDLIQSTFDNLFSLFDYFSDLYYDSEIHSDKFTYEELITDLFNSI